MRGEHTVDARSHRRPCEPLSVGGTLTLSVFREGISTGMPRDGSGSLSTQPVGYTSLCTTDAVTKPCAVFQSWFSFG